MRIAIIYDSPSRLATSSIRYERYADGFRELGCEAVIVTTRFSAEGYSCPCRVVEDRQALLEPTLWDEERFDVALLPTWLGKADLLNVVRSSGCRTVALTDTDGYIGARVHFRELLTRLCAMQRTIGGKVRAFFWGLRQYLWFYRELDGSVLDSMDASDRVVVCSPFAVDNLKRFFSYHQRADLNDKLSVTPYPVDPSFESGTIGHDRAARVLAIGRWDDDQKDPRLLYRLLRRRIESGAESYTVVGTRANAVFGSLARLAPRRVELIDSATPEEIRSHLRSSQILLSTSKWESGPIVASEALLSGCSLVGPASVPKIRWLASLGYGTVFERRTVRAVETAIETELENWRTGRRDSEAIAAAWRGKFTAAAICRGLLAGLDVPLANSVAR